MVELIGLRFADLASCVLNQALNVFWGKPLPCPYIIGHSKKHNRMFSFGDFLSCNDSVLGSRTLLLLIEEMKCFRAENSTIPTLLAHLRQVRKPSWSTCVVSVTAENICDDLSKAELFRYPKTFGRALQMIQDEGRNLKAILLAGRCHLHLNVFPSYRKRNGFKWNNFQISKILYDDLFENEIDINVGYLTINVIHELKKKRGLSLQMPVGQFFL